MCYRMWILFILNKSNKLVRNWGSAGGTGNVADINVNSLGQSKKSGTEEVANFFAL